MSREKKLPKLTDVEDTIEDVDWKIKDICIDYYNKGYDQALQDVLEILDIWYKDWKRDKTQEFWIDDFEQIKKIIQQLTSQGDKK